MQGQQGIRAGTASSMPDHKGFNKCVSYETYIKQEMFVKHWPPARSKWNTCLDLHLTYMYVVHDETKSLDQHLYLTH